MYTDVAAAAERMGSTHRAVYQPNESRALEYDELFREYARLRFLSHSTADSSHVLTSLRRLCVTTLTRYRALHDHFGRQEHVMRRLKAMRRKAAATQAA
jgi:L-ribulokinase